MEEREFSETPSTSDSSGSEVDLEVFVPSSTSSSYFMTFDPLPKSKVNQSAIQSVLSYESCSEDPVKW